MENNRLHIIIIVLLFLVSCNMLPNVAIVKTDEGSATVTNEAQSEEVDESATSPDLTVTDMGSVAITDEAQSEEVDESPASPDLTAIDEGSVAITDEAQPKEVDEHLTALDLAATDMESAAITNGVQSEEVDESPASPDLAATDEGSIAITNEVQSEEIDENPTSPGLATTDMGSAAITDAVQSEEVNESPASPDLAATDEDSVAITDETQSEEVNERPASTDFTVTDMSGTEVEAAEINRTSVLWMYLALIIMSIATLLSVVISLYLYRWQRILLAKSHSMAPEQLIKHLDNIDNSTKKLAISVTDEINNIKTEISGNTHEIKEMIEILMTFQKSLDKKDGEIDRLKKGYDAQIFRKFLYRFIEIDKAIDEATEPSKDLKLFKRLFDDAFDECGVEKFAPEIGEDYRSAFGVADKPEQYATEDSEKDSKVAKILEEGYKLRSGDTYEVVVPARVAVYRYGEEK